MKKSHYLTGEVARLLKTPAHKITYAIGNGYVPEPAQRIANKRLFAPDDIDRLARHLNVPIPPLDPPVPAQAPPEEPEQPFRPPYSIAQAGSTGHEVLDAEGSVVCWASERSMALLLAGLMEHASGR